MASTSRSAPRATPRATSARVAALRFVGALGSALGVAFIGVAALPPATAAAAGVVNDQPRVTSSAPAPADVTPRANTRPVSYRWDGAHWVRTD